MRLPPAASPAGEVETARLPRLLLCFWFERLAIRSCPSRQLNLTGAGLFKLPCEEGREIRLKATRFLSFFP
jgi:hypothetical protein